MMLVIDVLINQANCVVLKASGHSRNQSRASSFGTP
jgi:hypothetical protein